MENQFDGSAKRTRMIVLEPFEATDEREGSSMWFTPHLEIFVAVDQTGDDIFFTFENRCFYARREIITAHCTRHNVTSA
jgi:hypothetical protein